MKAAKGEQGSPILTHTEPICIVRGASAKSGARYWRIGTNRRNSSRTCGFFVACIPASAFYGSCGGAGEIRGGLPIDRYANPITTASISTIGVVNGGSDSIGAYLMALYRLAVLSGTGANLCTYTIHSYRTITATSYKAARQIAAFEGALVIGWRVVK